jgi:hypothetical protein
MRRQLSSVIALGAILVVGGFHFFIFPSAAQAQSDLVFMTADDFDPAPQSYLYRFDMGTQTFAVDTGAGAGFQGVTVLGNEVLVADYLAERIQRFSPTGAYLGPFATLTDPTFLESDASGNVYTTSTLGGFAPRRLNSSGTTTQVFSHPNLTSPRGIDADVAGNVYVANLVAPDTGSLFKFASDGTFISNTPLGSIRPYDISIDEAGERLIMADPTNFFGVRIYDISGAAPIPAFNIFTPGSSIVGVHYANDSGNILAAEQTNLLFENPRGLEFSPAGVLLDVYVPAGAEVGSDIVNFVQIPEPASAALMLVAVAAGGVGRRRR